ncbi:MAG: FAD-binding oxidoreductase, partial [Microthrixaceae bacterium]|nr:FAD-binding oxidoreductase [Microthrixaceae bacterium]
MPPSPTTIERSHRTLVEEVARSVRDHAGRGTTPHITKAGQHHVVPLPGDSRFRGPAIDTSGLCNLVAIDPDERTFTAEPGLSFNDLVNATLEYGLIPKVVPELKGITVGGAVAGSSLESMSYRYGGLHDSCRGYEVVTGTGEVLRLSHDHRQDLFDLIHGSYGTLGIITEVTGELVPATRTVRLDYHRHDHLASFTEELLAVSAADREGPPEFVDAIVHSPTNLVLVLGTFVDDPPPPAERWLTPFYRRSATGHSELLRTEDYLFRYDADCHWLARTVPPLEWSPVRRLVGRRLLGADNLIAAFGRTAKLMSIGKRRSDLVCDIFVPQRNFEAFFEWHRTNIDHWPLWVVPYRTPEPYPWMATAHGEAMSDDLYIDCAIYGAPNNDRDRDLSALLEEAVFDLDGIKTLIGRNHYTEERFWQIYNRDTHLAAKAELDPNGL